MATKALIQYETRRVKFTLVQDNPNNARKLPPEGTKERMGYDRGIKDLSDDIKANGNLAPMVVILTDDTEHPYTVKEGSRRYAAFTLLDVEEVDVRIAPFKTDLDYELVGLAGNLDREPLTPYETAMKLAEIKRENKDLSDAVIATRVGRSKSFIQNLLRLAQKLNPKILAVWSTGSDGLATTDNLLKIAKEDDKTEQWRQWQILHGVDPDAGTPVAVDPTAPVVPPTPARNAKKAAQHLLGLLSADKELAKRHAWSVQILNYILGTREPLPVGLTADPKGQRGKGTAKGGK